MFPRVVRVAVVRFVVVSAAVFLCLTTVAADDKKFPVHVDEGWNRRFEPRDGWAGGDAVYSTQLVDGRVLWLFADSFAGPLTVKEGKPSRPGTKFLNNTAAVSNKPGSGEPSLKFFIAKKEDGSPDTWIKPDEPDVWYWPAAPVTTKTGVAILLWRVEKAKGGGAFGFRVIGADVAIADDTQGELADWKFKRISLPFCGRNDNRTIIFGAAATVIGDEAFVFGWRNRTGGLPDNQALLAKIPRDQLHDPGQWRFFAGRDDGKKPLWTDSIDKAEVACRDIASELSVSYDAPRKRWIMIHHEGFLGPHIVARTAPDVTGPWSTPEKIYRCPEVDWHKSVFSYASKGHPEYSGPDDLLITYATNSHDFVYLIQDARVYIPRAIRLDLRAIR